MRVIIALFVVICCVFAINAARLKNPNPTPVPINAGCNGANEERAIGWNQIPLVKSDGTPLCRCKCGYTVMRNYAGKYECVYVGPSADAAERPCRVQGADPKAVLAVDSKGYEYADKCVCACGTVAQNNSKGKKVCAAPKQFTK